jgi:hypothetical protein
MSPQHGLGRATVLLAEIVDERREEERLGCASSIFAV